MLFSYVFRTAKIQLFLLLTRLVIYITSITTSLFCPAHLINNLTNWNWIIWNCKLRRISIFVPKSTLGTRTFSFIRTLTNTNNFNWIISNIVFFVPHWIIPQSTNNRTYAYTNKTCKNMITNTHYIFSLRYLKPAFR